MGSAASGKRGLDITPDFRVGVNRTGGALAVGDVVMFNITRESTTPATDNTNKARDNSAKVNLVTPTDATVATILRCGLFCVVLEPIADDAEGQVALRGENLAILVDDTNADVAGSPLVPQDTTNAADPSPAVPAGEKVIGFLAADIGGATGTVLAVASEFNGVEGFGNISG